MRCKAIKLCSGGAVAKFTVLPICLGGAPKESPIYDVSKEEEGGCPKTVYVVWEDSILEIGGPGGSKTPTNGRH